MEVFIKIGLRSRATAPGPTCSASGSLIRARHRVRRGGVPSRWYGPGSYYLPKAGDRLRRLDLEMKSRSLLKAGSGVAPPHPARSAALPGLSFGLGTASAAAESLHDGTDPEARPSAFWRKVRDSGSGK